jgi:hypothetical protein
MPGQNTKNRRRKAALREANNNKENSKPDNPSVDKLLMKEKDGSDAQEYEKNEPLLQPNPRRFVLFPIKYHEVCLLHDLP